MPHPTAPCLARPCHARASLTVPHRALQAFLDHRREVLLRRTRAHEVQRRLDAKREL